jgi:hypothetical protein
MPVATGWSAAVAQRVFADELWQGAVMKRELALNPLRSEAEAYTFVIGTLGCATAVVVAYLLGGKWAGIATFAALTSGACAWSVLSMRPALAPRVSPLPRNGGERRVLVVANETITGRRLHDEIRRATSSSRSRVLVVSPALNSPLRHLVSDEDWARAAAQERLDQSLAALSRTGIHAHGQVGDADPLQAIEDALRTFGAEEIIISTHPQSRSNWLERDVVSTARERFQLPITHITVDLEAEVQASC